MDDFSLAIPGLSFEFDAHDMQRAQVHSPLCDATIYLHGAHLTHWQPRGESPVLFLSRSSEFAPDRAIRGGVPIIFPWFGARENKASHGWARRSEWKIESARERDGEIEIVFGLASRDVPESEQACGLRFLVRAGAGMTMQLEIENKSDSPLVFQSALHTYFAVADIREVEIEGLCGAEFLDKVAGLQRVETQARLRVDGEIDRIYASQATVTIDDMKLARRIIVEKSGSNETVVWNPWIDKAAALPDFGDDEWSQMLCVETAKTSEIELAPRQTHRMTVTVRVEKYD